MFGFNECRIVADWSIENMSLDVTPYRMLEVTVLPKLFFLKDAKNIYSQTCLCGHLI